MIFIHGAGLNSSIWHYQVQAFAGAHFPTLERVRTDHPSISDFTNYISTYIQRHNIESPVLIGHSLGGGIALDYVLSFPHTVRALILISTSPIFQVPQKFLDMILSDFDGFIATIMTMGFCEDASEKAKKLFVQTMKATGAQTVYHDYVCANTFDIQDRIHHITVPTLILAPAEDQMLPLDISIFLSEHIKDSSLKIIEGAGHMVIVEHPDLVNTEIQSFMDELE
ncbi:MAG: alpha/beta hydrolase [Theionarchaea archaeon]|nr:alpha/beta hydrolase [Theionarchaea archaeon]